MDADSVVKQIVHNESLMHDIQCMYRYSVPATNSLYLDCEWGYQNGKEFISGTRYAKDEDGTIVPYTGINAFDGKAVRSYNYLPRSGDKRGGVYGYDPHVFSVPLNPKALLGYTIDQNGLYTLSELLSDKYVKHKEVRPETLGDTECILLEAIGFQTPGANHVQDLRIRIDPKRNYRPLRMAKYESPDDEDSLACLRGKRWELLSVLFDNITLQDIDGIWFPVSGERTLYINRPQLMAEGKTEEDIRKQYPDMSGEDLAKTLPFVPVPFAAAERVEVRDIKINKGIDPAKFTIVFPDGCKLWDDFAGVGYVVGDTQGTGPEPTARDGTTAQPKQEHLTQADEAVNSERPHTTAPQQVPPHSTASGTKGPRMSCVNDSSFDWGVLNEDASIEHEFIIRNEGSADLIIEHVKTGCGCTQATISKHVFAPNEAGTLKAKYTARNNPDRETIAVWVKSNDTNTPVKQFVMTGLVRLALACRPKSLSFDLATESDNPISQTLQVKANMGTIELVKCSVPDAITLEWRYKDGGYECEVKPKIGATDTVNQKIVAEFMIDNTREVITVPVYFLH